MTDAQLDYLEDARAAAAAGADLPDPTPEQEASLTAREQQLVAEIGRTLVEHETAPWVRLVHEVTTLHRTSSSSLAVVDAEGASTKLRQPRALNDLDAELRTVTYRAARGAYFAATITVTPEGTTAEYSFDTIQPRHAEFPPADIAPAFHADLAAYPRRDSGIPSWLAEMLRHSPVQKLHPRR
jgi:hypothetical protein